MSLTLELQQQFIKTAMGFAVLSWIRRQNNDAGTHLAGLSHIEDHARRLREQYRALEEAARDLYANPRAVFRYVTFPLVLPGILGAALLGFSLSFDDFIISYFNAGTLVTFPIFIWGAAQRGIPVQVNALATIVFVVALLVVLTGQFVSARRRRALERPAPILVDTLSRS